MTADRLTRTSVWLEKLEGGIDHIRDVVIHDKLGIAAELEAMTQRLVDTYECEWAAVVRDPEKRRRFRQFVNSDESEPCIEFVSERGQDRPADWPSEFVSLEQFRMLDGRSLGEHAAATRAGSAVGARSAMRTIFPIDGGATVKYGKSQIAVFNFASRGEWYATQNMCPHKKAFVLSRGIIGTRGRRAEGRLPASQEDVLARNGRIAARRGVSHPDVSRESRRAERYTSSCRRPKCSIPSWRRKSAANWRRSATVMRMERWHAVPPAREVSGMIQLPIVDRTCERRQRLSQQLLDEQQSLSAVEQFSEWHTNGA